MSMQLTSDDFEGLAQAVANLNTLDGVEITQFRYRNHTIYVTKNKDEGYTVQGITNKNPSDPPSTAYRDR